MLIKKEMLGLLLISSLVFAVSACSVNVRKDQAGEKKNVDIETPFGGIHVNENADVRDTGLSVYPGARPKPKGNSEDEKNANVNISAAGYSLRVIAVEYETDDSPAKVRAFYTDQLKKFGAVLECHTSGHSTSYTAHNEDHKGADSDQLKCEGDNSGKNIELKAGTESNQHIVSVQPQDHGTDFALVYVRTHGKEGSI